MKNDKYEAVIGLEVHAQLLTKSKLFCGDSAAFGAEPNTHISPVTLAHPGTLPKMNKQAIEYALKLGIALRCDIEQHNYFARKNYFYPDLPKGYQISQHTTPICKNGLVPITVDNVKREILLNRIHIEEDAGKSLHDIDEKFTSIDLNRAGVPLLEIVSEPDLHTADEAAAYLTELRKLVRWIGVCDGNMEEGSMRCDANISVRLKGDKKLGTRVEVKNLNSIKNVKKAIEIEIDRLIDIVEAKGKIKQETRSFNADNNTTFSLRSKEEADDYRYFADPDLTPFHITDEFLKQVKAGLPELPEELENEYVRKYGLTIQEAKFLCNDIAIADFFEGIIEDTSNYKSAAIWMMQPIQSRLNGLKIEITEFSNKLLSPKTIAELIKAVDAGEVSYGTASRKLFNDLIGLGQIDYDYDFILAYIKEHRLGQDSNGDSLAVLVDEVIAKMPNEVKEYKKGKTKLLDVFIGRVRKLSNNKAEIEKVKQLLAEKLK
jgi:aspartyl-tRNA(Asn)/glutamyl-tRNA(Gln) amidotransferase subunit B